MQEESSAGRVKDNPSFKNVSGPSDQNPYFPSHHAHCTKLQNKEHGIEVLHRAKFKFPGHQKIHVSKKWGLTKFNEDELEEMAAEKWLILNDCGVKYIFNHSPVDKR
ncbi:60S ribosomal protein L10 [Camelus dromedarius]|uniref:60S ribosomal protein L10 n=1 Tax=Camelus dromedarius TaxID=9838 RepID=A0A5N4D3Q4_CAMDR|nr:60S ribosomal protein L10 [Camelus dromedarius]